MQQEKHNHTENRHHLRLALIKCSLHENKNTLFPHTRYSSTNNPLDTKCHFRCVNHPTVTSKPELTIYSCASNPGSVEPLGLLSTSD